MLSFDHELGLHVDRVFDTQDGVFDCAWSELHESHVVAAGGDGGLRLFDATSSDAFPVRIYRGHGQEAVGVEWNMVAKTSFASVSWDKTVRVWEPEVVESVRVFAEHAHHVYALAWSPHSATTLASVSGDRTLKVWDMLAPASVQTVLAHDDEVLAVDWDRYCPHNVVTGSADASICVWVRVAPRPARSPRLMPPACCCPPPHPAPALLRALQDLRQPGECLTRLLGHRYAVKRLRCSPFERGTFASAAYDMCLNVWNWEVRACMGLSRAAVCVALKRAPQSPDPLRLSCDHHTEFVVGVDYSLFEPGLIASCAWDRYVCAWNLADGMPPRLQPQPPELPAGAQLPGPAAPVWGDGTGSGVG